MLNDTIARLALATVEKLSAERLPIHVTEAEVAKLFAEEASTFNMHFDTINQQLQKEGFWAECVLCSPQNGKPRTGYYTFYRHGQKSLFVSATAPETGPYFIPDELRS